MIWLKLIVDSLWLIQGCSVLVGRIHVSWNQVIFWARSDLVWIDLAPIEASLICPWSPDCACWNVLAVRTAVLYCTVLDHMSGCHTLYDRLYTWSHMTIGKKLPPPVSVLSAMHCDLIDVLFKYKACRPTDMDVWDLDNYSTFQAQLNTTLLIVDDTMRHYTCLQ